MEVELAAASVLKLFERYSRVRMRGIREDDWAKGCVRVP
jgi:hypothetical protein